MTDFDDVETLLQDAIDLLADSGFPLAAETLRDNLRVIRQAPTAGARRHRMFQLRDLFDGAGSAADMYFCTSADAGQGLRFRRTDEHRHGEQRYRRTLALIQEILAADQVA